MAILDDRLPENLVDRIYEAAVLPEFWPNVLRDLAVVAKSEEALVLAGNDKNFKWVSSSARMDEMTLGHYNYAGGVERTRRLLALQRAGFATDSEVFSESEILNLPVFTDFLIPAGLGRGIATAIPIPGGENIIFNIEGRYFYGLMDPVVLQQLDELRPHLARSALISMRLAFERARSAVETLAALGFAACAVRQSGAVLVANQDFSAEQNYWTTRGGDRIALFDRRADRQLYDALNLSRLGQSVRSLPIAAREEGAPAVLHVVPIRRAAHELFTEATAILVLMRSSQTPAQATPLLQTLFDLSATEANIAARISAGETVETIARRDGKSAETVRNQVKSILNKTGCRRQVELARMLAQLMPTGR